MKYVKMLGLLAVAAAVALAVAERRLTHLIELHQPEVVAVDSVPHEGIVEAVRAKLG